MTEKLADGVYFGLPMADYLAQPHLGSSSVKELLQSPLTYWANSPHNPRRRERESAAANSGTAYHTRILEGEAAFRAQYAPAFDPADHPGALRTQADLKERLAELGEKVSGTKAEQIARLLAVEPDAEVLDQIQERYEAGHPGKIFLSREDWDGIRFACECMEASGAAELFKGGAPEVTVLWHDENGIPRKARIDYVRAGCGISLKTFANPAGIPLGRLPGWIIARDRHDISAFSEMEALQRMRTFINADTFTILDGAIFHGQPIDVISEIKHQDRPTYTFVFQERGSAPNVAAVQFNARDVTGQPTEYWQKAREDSRAALKTYATFSAEFGFEKPWVYAAQPEQLDDADFPAYHIKG